MREGLVSLVIYSFRTSIQFASQLSFRFTFAPYFIIRLFTPNSTSATSFTRTSPYVKIINVWLQTVQNAACCPCSHQQSNTPNSCLTTLSKFTSQFRTLLSVQSPIIYIAYYQKSHTTLSKFTAQCRTLLSVQSPIIWRKVLLRFQYRIQYHSSISTLLHSSFLYYPIVLQSASYGHQPRILQTLLNYLHRDLSLEITPKRSTTALISFALSRPLALFSAAFHSNLKTKLQSDFTH